MKKSTRTVIVGMLTGVWYGFLGFSVLTWEYWVGMGLMCLAFMATADWNWIDE
jgi:hypothetical protein